MKNSAFIAVAALLLLVGCQSEKSKDKTTVDSSVPAPTEKKIVRKKTMSDAATILAKKEVPILCYHNLKELKAGDGEMTKTYTVTPGDFAQQMKALSDAGYHSILPNQLYDYLVYDVPLPSNPVMITFDDTRGEQYSIGAAEMKKYGFKGVFFLMTVSIGRPNYLSKEEIKSLSDSGHVIAAHTWDHHMVTKYTGDDWNTQLVKPKSKLEEITGKPVTYFAYPFGLWNKAAIPELKKSGYQMAYILATERDPVDPLYTIRRIIVAGQWSKERFMDAIKSSFH